MAGSVAIIAGTLWGNRGAQAMLESVVGQLRERDPDLRVVIFSYYPTIDAGLVNDPNIEVLSATPAALVLSLFPGAMWSYLCSLVGLRWPDRWLPRGVARLRQCRILLDIPGISFSDGREKFLPFNILTLYPAMLMGVPVGKFSQAMGPFANPLNHLCAKFVLNRCAFVAGRGAQTFSFLREINSAVPELFEAPDLAFNHEPHFSLTCENEGRTTAICERLRASAAGGRRLICINPSSLVARESEKRNFDLIDVLTALASDLIAAGYRVVCVPTATRDRAPDSSHNNDIPIVRQIAQRIDPTLYNESFFWIDWDLNFTSLKRVMVEADAVVTLRFHGLVAALSLGRAVMAVGWGHKYDELMAMLGLEDWALDCADLASISLFDRVMTLLSDKDRFEQVVAAGLPDVKRRSADQFTRAFPYLM
jgi:colanic acid/amylovoran biosynthesis protein